MPSAPRKRILIAEDDPAIALLVEKSLAALYQVSVVRDGMEALKSIRREVPHLLLLDVGLPSVDGFAVAAAARGSDGTKQIPIMFLTARDTPADRIRGINVGAKHYITKPFKIDDLVTKVKRILPA
jgi:DNA-binding response OmpR family regulator